MLKWHLWIKSTSAMRAWNSLISKPYAMFYQSDEFAWKGLIIWSEGWAMIRALIGLTCTSVEVQDLINEFCNLLACIPYFKMNFSNSYITHLYSYLQPEHCISFHVVKIHWQLLQQIVIIPFCNHQCQVKYNHYTVVISLMGWNLCWLVTCSLSK